MTWFGRAEDPALCPGPMGAVQDAEVLARLLHETNVEPPSNRFLRKEVFSVGLNEPSHGCGVKDGASVDRCDGLSDEEIMRRSVAQAERKPGRSARGAHYALAEAVRSLRLPGLPDRRLFRVYDDARLSADDDGPENLEHAVIRGDDTLTRPQQSGALGLIISIFKPTRRADDAGQLHLPLRE